MAQEATENVGVPTALLATASGVGRGADIPRKNGPSPVVTAQSRVRPPGLHGKIISRGL